MRGYLLAPVVSAAVVAASLVAGAAGAGGAEPSRDVAKTTIGPGPTAVGPSVIPPTAPVPTAPPVTAPAPTAASPTAATVATTSSSVVGGPDTTDDSEESGLSPESLAIALPIFGFDPARVQCIDAAQPALAADDAAVVAALQGCGIGAMPLLRGMVAVAQSSNTFLDATATTVALPPVPGIDELPREDAFMLGFMTLLTPEETGCLATGLAGATAEDDATALAIVQRCQVGLGFSLDLLLFGLLGDTSADPSATTLPIAPTVPVASTVAATTVTGSPTSLLVAPDGALVDEFQAELLAEQGVTLDDQQAACVLSEIIRGGDLDSDDLDSVFGLLEACGISLTDLVPNS